VTDAQLNDGQACSQLEVFDEVVALLPVGEVVASREELADLELALIGAVLPQVLAEAGLRRDLTVVREVIVELALSLDDVHLSIGDVELDMEVSWLLCDCLLNCRLSDLLPAHLLHCASDEGLDRVH